MFRVNYKDTGTTIMTLFWCLYDNFKHISHIVLTFPLLTLNRQMRPGINHYRKRIQRTDIQKQPPRRVLGKRFSENMQQIYRRTPMQKCDFNKGALQLYRNHTWHGYSPVNMLYIFRTPFLKNIPWWLLLHIVICFILNS